MKKVLLITAVLALLAAGVNPAGAAVPSSPDETRKERVAQGVRSITVPFIANEGQANRNVKFYARMFFGGAVFVTRDGELVYAILKKEEGADGVKGVKAAGFKEIFAGGRVNEAEGESRSVTTISSFSGSDPSSWMGNIPTYGSVNMGEVYDGIRVRLIARGNNVEKLFYVNPQADPGLIRVEVDGVSGLSVNASGELEAVTGLGVVRFTKPVAYQEAGDGRQEISSAYEIVPSTDGRFAYTFRLGEYDRTRELVIDPLLSSTFIGGSGYDYAYGVAVDASGSVYVAGATASPDYPSASIGGARAPGGYDVFISKFDSGLTTLISTAFIGGAGEDYAYALSLDPSGNVYVAGATSSTDFPVTTAPYDWSHNGGYDAFVAKLDPTLSTLAASTFIGGAGDDFAYAMAVDGSGGVYVAGRTGSSGFPVSGMPFDAGHNGGYDAFVSRLDPDLSALEASTFLGGADYDRAYALAFDRITGTVYVAGRTASTDYPTAGMPYDSDHNGGNDAFVSRLDASLSYLFASTFLGGADYDYAAALAVDSDGRVYVAGATASAEFPLAGMPYGPMFNGGYDAFVSRLDPDLSTLEASTFLGGLSYDYASSLAVADGEVYVAGFTYSSDYPVEGTPFDGSHNGGYDVFVSRLDGSLSALRASTYMGGASHDYAGALVVDPTYGVYAAGYTYSSGYPVAEAAYAGGYNGDWNDVFVSRLDAALTPGPDVVAPAAVADLAVASVGADNITLDWTAPGDDGGSGVAASYDIRRSVSAMGEESWAEAPRSTRNPVPGAPGASESFTMTGLACAATYYVAMKTSDEAGNLSVISNVVSASTAPCPDTTPPSDVAGLTAIPDGLQAALAWTNPADEDFAGVKALRKAGVPPASCSDITASTVYKGSGTGFADAGLSNDTTYYYTVCAYDGAANYSDGVTASVSISVDVTPPGEAASFSVINQGDGGKLSLAWTNPAATDFAGVKVVRATGPTAPADCSAGTAVYGAAGTGFIDAGLTDGTAYSYRACTYDTSGNYSSGVTASATPADTNPPGDVSALFNTIDREKITLFWTNPQDSDFAGVKVVRKTGAAPASCAQADAVAVYSGGGSNHPDAGLEEGTIYYYRVCAYDFASNHSAGVVIEAATGADTTPPSPVADLSASSAPVTYGAALLFTAPGDDETLGTASSYDIRLTDAVDYPAAMTGANMGAAWDSLTQATGEPAPQAGGSSEAAAVQADIKGALLKPNTMYYFVVKATDDSGNVSEISNAASAHTGLKAGYNAISVPYKLSSGGGNTLATLFGDDTSYGLLAWKPTGLDSGGVFNGGWVEADAASSLGSGFLADGGGFYVLADAADLTVLDEKDGSGATVLSSNTDPWTGITLSQGRNIIGNPYLKNVDFNNVKICRGSSFNASSGCYGGTIVSFMEAVEKGWMDGAVAYFGNSTAFTYETCSSLGCSAVLRPWHGLWVYLLDGSEAYILAVPRP